MAPRPQRNRTDTRNTSTPAKPSTALRAAVYCRISLDRSGEGLGVERQRQACLKLATERGWTVDSEHVYIDNDTSAYSGKVRPAYEAMLQAVEAQSVDVVIVWHNDRLTRRVRELERYIEVCEPAGVPTYAVTAGVIDLSTPSGRMTARIAATVAQMEVEHKGERQMASNSRSADKGEAPRTGRAFGYTIKGELVPDEAESVREVFARFVNGSGLTVLADWLNASGFRNVRGREWNRTSVRAMLENPRYIAERWTLRTKRDRDGKIAERTWEYVGTGAWQPIVAADVFAAAGAILNDPARKASAREGNARKYLGSGCFLCDKCGEPVATNYVSTGNGGKYRKYECRARGCWGVARHADYVDEVVEAAIIARLDDPGLVAARAHDRNDQKVRAMRDEAAALRERLDGVAADYADGLLTGRDVAIARERIEGRLSDVESRLAALGAENALDAVIGAPDPGAAWLALDPRAKTAVIRALCTVRLMAGPGRRPSDRNPDKVGAWRQRMIDSIRIEWRA